MNLVFLTQIVHTLIHITIKHKNLYLRLRQRKRCPSVHEMEVQEITKNLRLFRRLKKRGALFSLMF